MPEDGIKKKHWRQTKAEENSKKILRGGSSATDMNQTEIKTGDESVVGDKGELQLKVPIEIAQKLDKMSQEWLDARGL